MRASRHILLVDDNRAHCSTLSLALETCGGFTVTVASDAPDVLALAASRAHHFDTILLDLAPVGAGVALCADLRRRGVRVPIILVTDADGEEDVVRGLDAGANDYVVKPFRLAELVARLRAQMRVFETSEDAVLVIGPYHFRPGSRSLTDPTTNRRVRLTEKEAAVLKHLYRAGSTPVPRQALLRDVWGYASGASTHTVETHIYRLRRKIEPDERVARILVNTDGGYRLGYDRGAGTGMAALPRGLPAMAVVAAE
ncbi:MAG: response regulator transcription factor [Alphaproteobacteria bacterium]|nr:response regulator transcription factor [Alphaproteobacteria bacterium]